MKHNLNNLWITSIVIDSILVFTFQGFYHMIVTIHCRFFSSSFIVNIWLKLWLFSIESGRNVQSTLSACVAQTIPMKYFFIVSAACASLWLLILALYVSPSHPFGMMWFSLRLRQFRFRFTSLWLTFWFHCICGYRKKWRAYLVKFSVK